MGLGPGLPWGSGLLVVQPVPMPGAAFRALDAAALPRRAAVIGKALSRMRPVRYRWCPGPCAPGGALRVRTPSPSREHGLVLGPATPSERRVDWFCGQDHKRTCLWTGSSGTEGRRHAVDTWYRSR